MPRRFPPQQEKGFQLSTSGVRAAQNGALDQETIEKLWVARDYDKAAILPVFSKGLQARRQRL